MGETSAGDLNQTRQCLDGFGIQIHPIEAAFMSDEPQGTAFQLGKWMLLYGFLRKF
jgi:hypothetical protein